MAAQRIAERGRVKRLPQNQLLLASVPFGRLATIRRHIFEHALWPLDARPLAKVQVVALSSVPFETSAQTLALP
jgi:hypothetical protein